MDTLNTAAKADLAREALIEDEDRPSMLRVVETIEPIDVKALPGDRMPMPPLST
jgi:hypothetical protein